MATLNDAPPDTPAGQTLDSATGLAPRRSARAMYTKFMIVVRRLHMYAGLLLLPWVLLYGLSGMLFNHPEWLGPVEMLDELSAPEVEATTGFKPLDAQRIASDVVVAINAKTDADVRLVPSTAVINDGLLFAGLTGRGRTLVSISSNDGTADVRRYFDAPRQDQPGFHGSKFNVDAYDPAGMTEVAGKLVNKAGANSTAPLRAVDGRGNVRFLVESASDGRRWNVIYNLPTGNVTARAADAESGVDFYSLVTRLHMIHHYPDRVGALWVWALIADITGITMMTWAVTGLIMWWQIKRTRVLGVMAVSVAVVAGALIFIAADGELRFGPARQPGPAIPAPPPAQGSPAK